MSDTPQSDDMDKRWDTGSWWGVEVLKLARKLERENAALREVLRMAKRYVPPQAVTNEWKTKPVSECRLLDKIESVLAEEEQP